MQPEASIFYCLIPEWLYHWNFDWCACVCQKIDQDVLRMYGRSITCDTRHGRCHHIVHSIGSCGKHRQKTGGNLKKDLIHSITIMSLEDSVHWVGLTTELLILYSSLHASNKDGWLWSTTLYLNKWANLVLAGMLFLGSVTPQAWVCMCVCVLKKKVKVYEIEGCVLLNFTQYCMPNNIYITVKIFFVQKIGNVGLQYGGWRKQTDCLRL